MAATKTKQVLEQELEEKDLALKQMQAQMAQMQEMIAKMASSQGVAQVVVEDDKLTVDDDVDVMNMCIGQLNLCLDGKGNMNGEGIYTFTQYGEVIPIPFAELKKIVNSNRAFAQEGKFYILDERAVKGCKLKTYYDRMISDEQMLNILEERPDKAIELYKLASKGQKETIIDMVVNKKLNGEKVDANILLELSELCGKKLADIENPLNIPVK